MIKRLGIIFLAVAFIGSMSWIPVIDSVAAAAKCDCGKDCKCEHCATGKGACHCKAGEKSCSCGKGCSCEHCKTGKGECKCHAGRDGKGCDCGKDCNCEHCKTGKGECSCKVGAKGCACKVDGKGGCSCKGDGKGGKGCSCGHCDADGKGLKGKHGRHGKGCSCGTDGKGGCHCGKDCQCEHCKTGKGTCSCKGDGKGGCSCKGDGKGGKGCSCGHCAMAGADASVKEPVSDADYATTMKSADGAFVVSYTNDAGPILTNKMMSWKLKVETADGKPIKDAVITVDGDMPEHGHGMPTEPKVTKNNGDGTYVVEGMKFSMTGWWTVTFTIQAGGKTGNVTFNLKLK